MFWKRESSPKFIATFEVGRLCKWLRILGYDTEYFNKGKKSQLIMRSLREGRVILTRESNLSRYSGIRTIRIKSDLVEEQVRQVLRQMRLKTEKDKMFTRCVLCNRPIHNVKKEDVKSKIPPYVYKTQNIFFKCQDCEKIYWKGTHWKLATGFLKEKAKI